MTTDTSSTDKLSSPRTAYIIGSGPSANDLDFNKFIGHDVCMINRPFLFHTKFPFKTRYYLLNDGRNGENLVDSEIAKRLTNPQHGKETEIVFSTNFYNQLARDLQLNLPYEVFDPGFITCSDGLSVALVFLMKKGYQRIVIFGLDFNYSAEHTRVLLEGTKDVSYKQSLIDENRKVLVEDNTQHFTIDGLDIYNNVRWRYPNLPAKTIMMKRTAERAEQQGIQIVNATRGTKTDVFPKCDLPEFYKAVKEPGLVAAILLGRKGSAGFPGKNCYPICGKPLASYPLDAAMSAKLVDVVYMSTDDPTLMNLAEDRGAKVIGRPAELCTDEALSDDAYTHGYNEIIKREGVRPEILVTLFCNAPAVSSNMIDKGVRILRHNSGYDSVVSVSKYNMYSPIRARRINDRGLLEPFVPLDTFETVTCDRNCQGDVWFTDCCLCVIRPKNIENIDSGLPPQKWMGKNIYPLRQVAGCDVDEEWQMPQVEWWLRNHQE